MNIGNSSTDTTFYWNNVAGANEYDVKIWRDKLWEGDPYHVEWGASNPFSIVLPAGKYCAYVDSRIGDKIVMNNDIEFTVLNGCKLNVEAGNSSTETKFSWNTVAGASEYDVKVWKDELWKGDPCLLVWGASDPCSALLPEGKYFAYVDTRYGEEIAMSNVVEFDVAKGCNLNVIPGNTSTETIFKWNKITGAAEYDVKVWKDELWKGDPCVLEWGASNPYSTILPEGKYFAYVNARVGEKICMSNVVEFDVVKGCKLSVIPGNDSTNTVFKWNKMNGATEYDVKVWKDELWKGDPCVLEWGASNPYSTILPEGKYYAYVDARVGEEICMSNVVEFNVWFDSQKPLF